ncbi:ABC transporter ATP-binding protein [Ammoniphilus sp. CFH 90114]|uniref:ABC transporter ATP-binding protein n=1 Tax=Ammoniphilus sp. CFH 90114 TaxID=2493665 RepID=UPI00100F502B|nr:ABC transporter ATP-binding protein [Ammoniphilus sp. CFH 90114]RXT04348.1 ABC transporter ATP-binding protein [Ammoniphilus sp. CFH 90114]
MSTQLIEVSKRFGDYEALKSIHLTFHPCEFIAILGPSGCGKTTLLRMLAGFDSPTTGEIHMNGQRVGTPDYALPPEKRNIGMVFQSFALWPHMKVKEQVEFPLLHHKDVPQELRARKNERVEEVLNMVGLKHLANRMPSELSGGQKQRVSLARAIAPKPSMLLMDEPLSSLDVELRLEMRREIQELHRLTKAGIIYVTHDQGEALAMADRIVVMKDGCVEQIGTPQEIYENPQTIFVSTFVGKANLIAGQWEGNRFRPEATRGEVEWTRPSVPDAFRKQQVYPVRPEQFGMERVGPGIRGTIINLQYQGKEIYYTVDTGSQQVEVHGSIHKPFRMRDEVVLVMQTS